MRTAWLVVGMVLLVVAIQGAVRLLVDHENAGLLGFLPGGFAVELACYLILGVVGISVAAVNAPRTRKPMDR